MAKLLKSQADIVAFFLMVTKQHNCLKKFVQLTDDRIMDGRSYKNRHPLLALDSLVKDYSVPGQISYSGSMEILVATYEFGNGYQSQDDALSWASDITDTIVQFVQNGTDHKPPIQNSLTWGVSTIVCDADCGWGWRTPFKICVPLKKCVDKCWFVCDPCPFLSPCFSYAVDANGCVTITNETVGASTTAVSSLIVNLPNGFCKEFSFTEKEIKLNEQEVLEAIENLFLDKKSECDMPISIELKVCDTGKDLETGEELRCCKYARAVLRNCISKGKSSAWCPITCTESDVSINPGS